jgi:hypothetical protein
MDEQRISLAIALKNAAQFYAYTVQELKRAQMEGRKDAINDAFRLTAEARDQCEKSWADLDGFVLNH